MLMFLAKDHSKGSQAKSESVIFRMSQVEFPSTTKEHLIGFQLALKIFPFVNDKCWPGD